MMSFEYTKVSHFKTDWHETWRDTFLGLSKCTATWNSISIFKIPFIASSHAIENDRTCVKSSTEHARCLVFKISQNNLSGTVEFLCVEVFDSSNLLKFVCPSNSYAPVTKLKVTAVDPEPYHSWRCLCFIDHHIWQGSPIRLSTQTYPVCLGTAIHAPDVHVTMRSEHVARVFPCECETFPGNLAAPLLWLSVAIRHFRPCCFFSTGWNVKGF